MLNRVAGAAGLVQMDLSQSAGAFEFECVKNLSACQSRSKATQCRLTSSARIGFRDLPEALALARGPASPDSSTSDGGMTPTRKVRFQPHQQLKNIAAVRWFNCEDRNGPARNI
jgi:hypothetical protein